MLTLVFPMLPFDSPENITNTNTKYKGFLMFSEGSKGNTGISNNFRDTLFRKFPPVRFFLS